MRAVPVPVSGQLVEAFVTVCKDMTWSAECLICNEIVANRTEAQNHLKQKHQVLALAEQTPVRKPYFCCFPYLIRERL